MKTGSINDGNLDIKHCKLKYYNGTFSEFANEVLSHGRGEGSVCRVCEIAQPILNDMKMRGVELLAKAIIITQRQVFKYRRHPKTKKGANIPVEEYAIIEKALKNPTHIYEDIVQKRLVYVCTHPYHGSRLVKVVVEPNYRSHGTIVNLAKSWGIVQKENMRSAQYRLIR